MPDVQSPNYLAALFSFLRVLATNVATALLPLFLTSSDEYPAGKATVIAVIVSALLTVVNFFRTGETRFGLPPNPGAVEQPASGGAAAGADVDGKVDDEVTDDEADTLVGTVDDEEPVELLESDEPFPEPPPEWFDSHAHNEPERPDGVVVDLDPPKENA